MESNDNQNNLPAISNEELIEKKVIAWGNLGLKTHNLGLELVSEAAAIKTALPMPTTIEQINSTDAALKIGKQKTTQLIEKRKSVTNLVNTAFSKLMLPEKDLVDTYIPSIEKKLIELKKVKKTADDLEQSKTDEKRRLKEEAIKYINDYDLLFKTEINKKTLGALNHALGEGNVTAEGLSDYLKLVTNSFKPAQFAVPVFKAVLKTITPEDYSAIWDEVKIAIKPTEFYVGVPETSLFEVELKNKFEFYEIALTNKEGALKQAVAVDAKTTDTLQKENASANVSATLQSMATTATVTTTNTTKALKQKFALDMVESEENALVIIAAFVANYDETKKYVRVTKAFELKVAQMGMALVGIKNNDNKFEFTNIKFKIIDTL